MDKVVTILMPMDGFDYLLHELNSHEFKLVIFFFRWTKGVKSDSVRISHDDIAVMANMNRSVIHKAIRRLVSLGLLDIKKKGGQANSYSLILGADLPENYEPPAAKVNDKWL